MDSSKGAYGSIDFTPFLPFWPPRSFSVHLQLGKSPWPQEWEIHGLLFGQGSAFPPSCYCLHTGVSVLRAQALAAQLGTHLISCLISIMPEIGKGELWASCFLYALSSFHLRAASLVKSHQTCRVVSLWWRECCGPWTYSRSWWWTEKHGMLQSMVSQRVRHDWVAELMDPHQHHWKLIKMHNQLRPNS